MCAPGSRSSGSAGSRSHWATPSRGTRGSAPRSGSGPVSCNENHGTQYREYNAVTLPQTPFSCQLGDYITAQSGWHDTITLYQAEMLDGSGLATGGVRTVGRIGYPIRTNHALTKNVTASLTSSFRVAASPTASPPARVRAGLNPAVPPKHTHLSTDGLRFQPALRLSQLCTPISTS